ncbi:MAG: hypothetical protein P8K68_07735 [Algibacter sp.]|uniref:hypothetical protein n=1 Tax=Algibacter sp. TaxID=1872428 RepID=UPI002603593D|nr:hypothetical protein [Algibacter sp.]MDG1729475.1 hypothetical protein [Algibacter sp.]MDG2178661.1 hypothetical protein [Algibacter sp.]
MPSFLKYPISLLIILLIFCCNNSDKKSIHKTDDIKIAEKGAVFSIDTSGISMDWTAYKFTNKVGVSGTFNDYTITKKKESGAVEDILGNLKLIIPTSTVNTKNPIRDFKLDAYFFKVFNTSTITGTILNAKGDEGFIKLQMNEKSRKIPYTYAIKNDTITLFTHLDLNLWDAKEALNTLNAECYELHKGEDGVSKLWPDVDVSIKLPLKKSDTNEL